MILFAPCKINIGLDVTAKRGDGYHELSTLMYPVRGLCDIVEAVRTDGDDMEFTGSGIGVDCPADSNLCVKAYKLLRQRSGIGGVKLHLHKAVPFGAGLGGGSSDAACTLRALDRLFGLGTDTAAMEEMAAQLGSDVPFFVHDRPMMATGRGEILRPQEIDLSGMYISIVKPPVAVSTAEAYGGITPRVPAVPLAERLAAPVSAWKETVGNAFEETIFAKHPVLAGIKERLYGEGALYASMSGSGAALYGIFAGRSPVLEWPEGYFSHSEPIA